MRDQVTGRRTLRAHEVAGQGRPARAARAGARIAPWVAAAGDGALAGGRHGLASVARGLEDAAAADELLVRRARAGVVGGVARAAAGVLDEADVARVADELRTAGG